MEFFLRYKNIVVPLLIVVGFLWGFKKVHTHFADISKALEKQASDLKQKEILLAKLGKINNAYSAVKDNFFAKDTTLFKRYVEDSARKNGVNITHFRPASERDQGFYWEVGAELVIWCSYTNLVKFIKSLEAKYISVSVLTLSGAHNRTEKRLGVKGIILKDETAIR